MSTNRDEKITALFARESSRLQGVVAKKVNASRETIEDACGFAWAQLLATDIDPDHATAFAWLVTVAIREAWTLTGYRSGATVVSADADDYTQLVDADPGRDLDAIIGDAEVRALLAQLPERQRKALTLQAIGLSYAEIGAALGWTYTAVNRHITEGRARIRKLRGGE